jgi:hypothetical protein
MIVQGQSVCRNNKRHRAERIKNVFFFEIHDYIVRNNFISSDRLYDTNTDTEKKSLSI